MNCFTEGWKINEQLAFGVHSVGFPLEFLKLVLHILFTSNSPLPERHNKKIYLEKDVIERKELNKKCSHLLPLASFFSLVKLIS